YRRQPLSIQSSARPPPSAPFPYTTLFRSQRDLIADHNRQLLGEQRAAKAIFDKVAHAGCLDAGNIRYRQSPQALFNGDVLLAAQDRKSTRLNSSHVKISYDVFCLKKTTPT